MKEIKVRGLTIKAPQDIAEELEKAAEPQVEAQEVEAILKEISEWLDSGRRNYIRGARSQLKKQIASGVAPWDTSAVVPSGARISNVGSVSGIAAVPNLPSWATGNMSGQQAVQQITVASVVEALMAALQPVISDVIQQISNMLGSFSSAIANIFNDLSNTLAENLKEAVETQKEVADALKEVASELKEAGGLEEESPMQELLPPTEIAPPVGGGEVPAPTPEGAPRETEGAPEEATPAEGGGGPSLPVTPELAEEEVRPQRSAVPPAPAPAAVFLSPQLMSALAQQLSKMTKEILETTARRPTEEQITHRVPSVSTFQLADAIADAMRKAGEIPKMKTDYDMTEPVVGGDVAEQIKGQPEAESVKKPLREAKKEAAKHGGQKRNG